MPSLNQLPEGFGLAALASKNQILIDHAGWCSVAHIPKSRSRRVVGSALGAEHRIRRSNKGLLLWRQALEGPRPIGLRFVDRGWFDSPPRASVRS